MRYLKLICLGIINLLLLGIYDAYKGYRISTLWLFIVSLILISRLNDYFDSSNLFILTVSLEITLILLCFISPFINKKRFKNKVHGKVTLTLMMFVYGYSFAVPSNIEISTSYGPSMEPTLKNGDTILLRKTRKGETFNHGDIVTFESNTDDFYGKRIFALPNETVTIKKDNICVNNKNCLQDDSLAMDTNLDFSVPENSYFVLGDNLSNSQDTRHFKDTFVYKKDIKYKYIGKVNLLGWVKTKYQAIAL